MSELPPNWTIREPKQGDATRLAALFDEDMRELGEAVELQAQRELAEAVITASASPRPACLCWVVEREGGAQGVELVAVLLANFNWSPKFGGRALWIESLYVTPTARRQGVGRVLVERLLDWSEDHGVRGVDIEAYHGNTPAGVLYRSLGFHRLGRERFAYRTFEA